MNLFLDTNILLDVLMKREPFFLFSKRLWELSEVNKVNGIVSALSFNNIFYIVRKNGGDQLARDCIKKIRSIFSISEVDSKILNQAIDSEIDDFEDAVQYFSALRVGARFLITRNPDDFPSSTPIAIITPEMFLKEIKY